MTTDFPFFHFPLDLGREESIVHGRMVWLHLVHILPERPQNIRRRRTQQTRLQHRESLRQLTRKLVAKVRAGERGNWTGLGLWELDHYTPVDDDTRQLYSMVSGFATLRGTIIKPTYAGRQFSNGTGTVIYLTSHDAAYRDPPTSHRLLWTMTWSIRTTDQCWSTYFHSANHLRAWDSQLITNLSRKMTAWEKIITLNRSSQANLLIPR